MKTKVLFRMTLGAIVVTLIMLYVGAFVLSSQAIVSGCSGLVTLLQVMLAVQHEVSGKNRHW